jgi:hypothetical protein
MELQDKNDQYKKLLQEVIAGAIQEYSVFTIKRIMELNSDVELNKIVALSFIHNVDFFNHTGIPIDITPNENWKDIFN